MAKGSVNKAIIIGRLGKDPEIQYLPSGVAVANMTIATDEGYKDKNTGQQVEKTEWHRVAAFGKLAEIIQQYVQKGAKVYIEGKLQTDEYEKDGVKRYSTKIVAHDMTMLDSRQQGQQQGQPMQQLQAAPQQQPQQAPQQAPMQQGQQQPSQAFDNFDDDVPF